MKRLIVSPILTHFINKAKEWAEFMSSQRRSWQLLLSFNGIKIRKTASYYF